MKRSKFGAGLLVALLILGGGSAWAMIRCSQPVSDMVEQAGAAALQQDWDMAEETFREAERRWEKQFPFCAAFADHEPMENINGLFAQLGVYASLRDSHSFAAACAQLSEDIQAIGDAHSLKWWNLL